jgi:hypothetical protein
MEAFDTDLKMSPRRRLLVIFGLALASWSFPTTLVYGVIQLL